MTRISPRVLHDLTKRSAEVRIDAIRENLRNKGIEHIALVDGNSYGLSQSEGITKLYKTPVSEFMRGKGEIGESVDVTEEHGATEEAQSREMQRMASAYVEAAVRRDRVQSSQIMRQLLEL